MSIKTNTTSLENILNKINSLPEAGIDLPQLSNEGASSHLLSGKELIDQEGNIVTGSMPNNGAINMKFDGINKTSVLIPDGYTSGGIVSLDNTISNEVSTQEGLIQQIKNTANSLPDAGGGSSGDTTGITVSVINNLRHPIIVNGRYCDVEQTINNVPYDDGYVTFAILLFDESEYGDVVSEYVVCPDVDTLGIRDWSALFYVTGKCIDSDGSTFYETCRPTCQVLSKYGTMSYNISGMLLTPPYDYVNEVPLNGATIEFNLT